jgi:hypothetical protein
LYIRASIGLFSEDLHGFPGCIEDVQGRESAAGGYNVAAIVLAQEMLE